MSGLRHAGLLGVVVALVAIAGVAPALGQTTTPATSPPVTTGRTTSGGGTAVPDVASTPGPTTTTTTPGFHQREDGLWVVPFESLGLAQPLRLSGQVADRRMSIPIPEGFRPVGIDATLAVSPDVDSGYLEFQAAGANPIAVDLGERAARQDTQKVFFSTTDAQVTGPTLGVDWRSRLRSRDDLCATALVGGYLDIREASLVLAGSPTKPESVGRFIPALFEELDVVVPPDPSIAEANAAMLVVAAAQKHSQSRPIVVAVRAAEGRGQLPDQAFSGTRRTIFVDGTTGSGAALVTVPGGDVVLRLGGDDAELGVAARTLANDLAPLAVGDTARFLELGDASTTPVSTRTFDYLGVGTLDGTGVSRIDLAASLSQSALGGPVKKVGLHLLGRHTPVTGNAQGNLSVRINDVLIQAVALKDDDKIDVTVDVPADLVARDMRLVVRAEYTPPDGICRPGVFPFTVQILPASTVTVGPGQGLPPSFTRYPQVLVNGFDMGFDRLDAERLNLGAQLVGSLQRSSSVTLVPNVVDLSGAIGSRRTAVVVGEDVGVVHDARPPLTQNPVDASLDGRTLLRLETDRPFAALQAFDTTTRGAGTTTTTAAAAVASLDRLFLTWRDGPAQVEGLAQQVNAPLTGWTRLQGDTFFQAAGTPPLDVSLRGKQLQPDEPEPPANILARALPIAAVAIVLLGLVLVAWFIRSLFKNRRARSSP